VHRDHKVCDEVREGGDDDVVCFVYMFLLSSGDDGLRE
jgi:hypothetical protein